MGWPETLRDAIRRPRIWRTFGALRWREMMSLIVALRWGLVRECCPWRLTIRSLLLSGVCFVMRQGGFCAEFSFVQQESQLAELSVPLGRIEGGAWPMNAHVSDFGLLELRVRWGLGGSWGAQALGVGV
jgi:hypothetical protein